jgi:hypothetical protein
MINKDYLFEKKYKNIDDLQINTECIYFYYHSSETRSYYIVKNFKDRYKNVSFIELEAFENEKDIIIDIGTNIKYDLRNSNSMYDLINFYQSPNIYIDTTGMNNRIVASLLNNSILLSRKKMVEINVIYVEPYIYKTEQFKLEGVHNNLSEKIDGIDPLPGFASIIPYTDEMIFVALLGFEGGRFSYLLEQIQPQKGSIIPIIGVPGFRIEYPFITLLGNKVPLEETKAWDSIEYIAANSIVDVYLSLNKILQRTSHNSRIVVAPIGTKPHAIAAILFAIKNQKHVEVVYDNPKRKINRTDGEGQIIVCNISSLLREI